MAEPDPTEISNFDGLWKGGYYESDPTEPLSKSSYRNFGYISTAYATYLRCIRPYIGPETVALEIGPGRGTWTKGMLAAKEVWAIDALSAEHNRFFEYLGHPKNVRYIQVGDFECRELPDGHFDYMFSFGCLCHVSFEGITAYAENLFAKLKPGANCFWMVADKARYEEFRETADRFDIWKQLSPRRGKLAMFRPLFDRMSKMMMPDFMKKDDFDASRQGHWYDAGVDRTCEMLESKGYRVIERDVGTVPRDPVIHFVRP
jgi:hypothetical protein